MRAGLGGGRQTHERSCRRKLAARAWVREGVECRGDEAVRHSSLDRRSVPFRPTPSRRIRLEGAVVVMSAPLIVDAAISGPPSIPPCLVAENGFLQ